MKIEQLDLSELKYLTTLDKRPRYQLSFKPDIESQFIEWIGNSQKNYFIAIPVIISIIWFGFFIADLVRAPLLKETIEGKEVFNSIIFVRTSILFIVLSSIILIYKEIKINTTALIMSCYFITCIGTAFISYKYQYHGMYLGGWLPVILIVPFFMIPSGCIFKHTLIWGVLTVVIFLSLHPFMLNNNQGHQSELYYFSVIISLGIGASCGFYKELLIRSLFIKTKLGDLHSLIDPLTNIGNRRYFEKIGKIILRNANRERKTIVFAMIDIDFFKKINDERGHKFGDDILKSFSHELKNITRRPLDVLARLGGEEFGIIFYDIKSQNVCNILENLQKKISNEAVFKLDDKYARSLSFSAGVFEVDFQISLEQLYKEADKLLYEAKENGRKRVITNIS